MRDGIVLERYKFILQQIGATNESVHRYASIFQAIATAVTSAIVALYVGYSSWEIDPDVARRGVIGLLVVLAVAALFTSALITSGILSWLDYRVEECELTATYHSAGFRNPPNLRNAVRWTETYFILFILASTITLWVLCFSFLFPQMR